MDATDYALEGTVNGTLSIRDRLKEAAELEKRAHQIRDDLIKELKEKTPEDMCHFLDAVSDLPFPGDGIRSVIGTLWRDPDFSHYAVSSWSGASIMKERMAAFGITNLEGVCRKLVKLEEYWDGLVTVQYYHGNHRMPCILITLAQN